MCVNMQRSERPHTGFERRRLLALGMAMPLVLAACRFPRDPSDTLERVSGGTVEVGVLESAPLAAWNGPDPEGVEVDLTADLAQTLSARPNWHARRDMALHEALERGDIDLLIGGLVADDPWSGRLAFTRPYLVESLMVEGRSGRPLDSIDGLEIAVGNTYLAGLVADAGGLPVSVQEPAAAGKAISIWRLPGEEAPEGEILLTRRHVMAVRLGENAWLLHLEQYLRGQAGRRARAALAMVQA